MRKQLILAALVAILAVAAIRSAAMAAGGGGFGSVGTTNFTDVSAGAALTDSNGTYVFIHVDRGIQTFKLRGVSGPPVMVGPETVLNYSSSSPYGAYASGCFVIPDSSFTVATDLSTASLQVDPSLELPCPGLLVPADAGGRPGVAGAAPDAGSGGGGGGGQPITANLTWASNGAVTVFNVSDTSRCQASVAHATSSSSNTFASLSGSVSPLADLSSTLYAAINEFKTVEVTTSAFSAACTGA